MPHFSAGRKKFARFTQKFQRPLGTMVVFLSSASRRVCVPFPLHIASLTAQRILPQLCVMVTLEDFTAQFGEHHLLFLF